MYAAAAADFGKPEAEVDLAEIMPVVSELAHIRKKLKRWMKPRPVRPSLSMLGTSSKIVFEPKGTSLVISPWNYPFNLTFGPMMSAIAAGNTVILKPSEMTPNMSKVIAEIVERAFRPEEVTLFEGNADVSSYLSSLPFDHIFFTGSPAVGKLVMAAAAKNLSSVTLELGEKVRLLSIALPILPRPLAVLPLASSATMARPVLRRITSMWRSRSRTC